MPAGRGYEEMQIFSVGILSHSHSKTQNSFTENVSSSLNSQQQNNKMQKHHKSTKTKKKHKQPRGKHICKDMQS
jgi:hypothetical protein